MKYRKSFIIVLLIVSPLVTFAQTPSTSSGRADTTALILSLQKQVADLLQQIQSLQNQISQLKSETGIVSTAPATEPKVELPAPVLPELTRILARGSRGDDVRKLQEFLAQDEEIYPEGLATGYYGPATEAAVRKWQRKQNIEAVGIVGPRTAAKFRELRQSMIPVLIREGAGKSPVIPPGLLTAPGIQKQFATSTIPLSIGTTTPAVPAVPAIPATLATPATSTPATASSAAIATTLPSETPPATTSSGTQPATPATPATPAQPASTATTTATTGGELKVTYPNGGETWYKGNSYIITWQNPLAGGFANQDKYYWNVLLKRADTAWQADDKVPVTQSSYTWSKWTGWPEPIPNASDFKVGISLVDTCAAQVGGVCPSASISITPTGGIDYSDSFFTVTTTPSTLATTDFTPPVISWTSTMDPSASSATIIWATDEASDSQVEYGLTTAYGALTTVDSRLLTTHSVGLSGLTPSSTYHYRVKSKDAAGNLAVSGDQTFSTLASGLAITSGPTTAALAPTTSSTGMNYSNTEVKWTTNTACIGTIFWGTLAFSSNNSAGDWWEIADTINTTTHQAVLTTRFFNSTFQYKVRCTPSSGSAVDSTVNTFTTGSEPTSTTATTTSSAYDQMKIQLKAIEIILKGLLGR